jgi:hypothetical protein
MGSIDRFIFKPGHEAMGGVTPAFLSDLGHMPRPRHWTREDVTDLMDALHPLPAQPGAERSVLRHQLSSAYLAGVAEAQDALLLQPRRTLVNDAIGEARTLMKNRAASQHDRIWHAFLAGTRAGNAHAYPVAANDANDFKVFIRQPLTESGESQQALIAAVLDQIERHNGGPQPFRYLTGHQAESADTFRQSFEAETAQPFTPQNFRAHRLGLLAQADAFVNIRVGMSESSAFELSYHVFRGACTPILFLVWKHAPIKTTLLKDLHNLCDVTYLEFESPDELGEGIGEFFRQCRR